MSNERVIVSLTTWRARIRNIPVVLDTIFEQTKNPDKVILNLAFDEEVPVEIQNYIENRSIEVFRVPDTKVYKKLIPTLRRYPNDCVISIDDDYLYPNTMIEDFWNTHLKYPFSPISGNRYNYGIDFGGIQCHCGNASLSKAVFFGEYLSMIDEELISNCPSDDIVYTFLSTKNHHPYVNTENLYFENMKHYNPAAPYSSEDGWKNDIDISYNYLVKRFGKIDYFNDVLLSYASYDNNLAQLLEKSMDYTRAVYKSTYSYKVGHALLSPLSLVKNYLKKR